MTIRLLLSPSIGTARARARAELLESSLADELGESVVIELSESYEALEEQVRRGGAELVWAPPAIVARVEPTAQAIFKCVRSGHASYRSALVVRADEQVSLTSGQGLRASWVERMSLGGHVLAVQHLRESGFDVDRLIGSHHFVGSYPDALRELLYEEADLAAIGVHSDDDVHVREAIARFAGRVYAERLTCLAVTRPVPSDALLVTEALPPDKTVRLTRRLLPEGDERPPAGMCLALEVERFDRALPGEYEPVRELLSRMPA